MLNMLRQGSKWADVPHFAALCCGYPEVRGGSLVVVKGELGLAATENLWNSRPTAFHHLSKIPSLLISQGL